MRCDRVDQPNGGRGIAMVVVSVLVLVFFVGTGQATEAPARRASAAALADPTTYPRGSIAELKGLQPDFWPHPADNTPGLGTVSINFFWPQWEPSVKAAPCDPMTEVTFDGRCFVVPAAVDAEVDAYGALGVAVTGIMYGTPSWARGQRACTPIAPGFEVFCVPEDPAEFARFVGMIAQRYDGTSGGRVSDFVIQNEVNTNDWFDIGCGQGTACPVGEWVATYAGIYNEAYDAIVVAQPEARVLFSFTQHFASGLDDPTAIQPVLSVQTFLTLLVPLVGARLWSVAIHPYPRVPLPVIDARDLPFVTLGNIGVLSGWLHAHYPHAPRAWEVQLTEVGLNNPDVWDAEQAGVLCASFRNVLATPGITSYIYHRLSDHPAEFGLKLGLRRSDGTPKPAFNVWHDANDVSHPSCGFEWAGRTRVQHGVDPVTGALWYSSRDLPADYVVQPDTWWLDREATPGTTMLFECGDNVSSYLSADASCPGAIPMGPVGAIRDSGGAGFTELFVCHGADVHIVSTDPACAGGVRVTLGYVAGSPPAAPQHAEPGAPAAVVVAPMLTG